MGLIVQSREHFAYHTVLYERKRSLITGNWITARIEALVEYDDKKNHEIIYKIDSLSFDQNMWYSSVWNNSDGFIAGNQEDIQKKYHGFLAKTRMGQGELWTRKFRYAREPKPDTSFLNFRFLDVTALPDGGALATRVFGIRYIDSNTVKGYANTWAVRVDSFGCVVPGCQNRPPDGIAPELPKARLLIAPNPASDVSYAHWLTEEPGEAVFSLRDAQGRLIRKWESNQPEMTFVIPLERLAAGMYYLNVVHHGKVLVSEKLVVLE